MASNNDCGVRDFDLERFELSKHFCFPSSVNVSISAWFIMVELETMTVPTLEG